MALLDQQLHYLRVVVDHTSVLQDIQDRLQSIFRVVSAVVRGLKDNADVVSLGGRDVAPRLEVCAGLLAVFTLLRDQVSLASAAPVETIHRGGNGIRL